MTLTPLSTDSQHIAQTAGDIALVVVVLAIALIAAWIFLRSLFTHLRTNFGSFVVAGLVCGGIAFWVAAAITPELVTAAIAGGVAALAGRLLLSTL